MSNVCRLLLMLCLVPAAPALAQVRLIQFLQGLSSPTFLVHAGDASNRLFVLEQSGLVDVVQPGSSTATVFLDIRSRVLSGGERGLLGLAFHPNYRGNGRFFVYYTRNGDGALTIAEYSVSGNPNVALSAETVLLTIPHPTNANHNGGMLAFGPGGYLFIGVGDGGSANDPPNNAQNIESLLGKLLRIDVDQPDSSAGTRYSAPPSNPFVGRTGRDEIFAYGLRNPWRFSFDRSNGQQWIADVGQNAREEVDTPILPGANYGWRVYEGASCTNNDPALCRPASYAAPLFDYSHTNSRCSITGGYVYRGSRATLAAGTYVYGDYCTGEIFTWDGQAQRVILSTRQNITSFGEDEQGELYVVSGAGRVDRIASTSCPVTLSPGDAMLDATGGTATITVTTDPDCGWTAASDAEWLILRGSANGMGPGTVTYTVSPHKKSWDDERTATITIGGAAFTVRQTR